MRQFIYIDESGDLGIDFTKRISRYFTMTALICDGDKARSVLSQSVKKTMTMKISKSVNELKGSATSLSVKKYFYKNIVNDVRWRLVSVTVDKQKFFRGIEKIGQKYSRNDFYNEVGCRLLEKIDYSSINGALTLIVDRSKNPHGIKVFDAAVSRIIKNRAKDLKFSIEHKSSIDDRILQAVDIFCWGLQRKYELHDIEWYDVFREKISVEGICDI